LIPGDQKEIKPADDLDEEWEKSRQPKLFRVSDAKGSLERTLEKEGEITKTLLDTNDVFILDVHCEIFVWIGKGATQQEKKNGMKFAQDYLTANKLPDWLPISRILEGGENETESYLHGAGRHFKIEKKRQNKVNFTSEITIMRSSTRKICSLSCL
jgi:hypothetical protein